MKLPVFLFLPSATNGPFGFRPMPLDSPLFYWPPFGSYPRPYSQEIACPSHNNHQKLSTAILWELTDITILVFSQLLSQQSYFICRMAIVSDHFDYLFKLVVIGDSGVGKTNLLSRYATNQFTQQSKPTIGVEFATKTITINQINIKVQIWDTAGQQRFRAITHAYYKGASGALLVFDLTRRSTFDNITKWYKQLKDNADEGIVCILVGNKSDLMDQKCIREDEIAEFIEDNKLFYLQTSALESTNVQKSFDYVIKQIYGQIQKKLISKQPSETRPKMVRQPDNQQPNINIAKNRKAPQNNKCCK